MTGAGLLWVGWFGFNAGSALAANGLAVSAFVATHLGAAAAALGWMSAEWAATGKPTVLGAASGAVAGLVAITPASGFVGPVAAIIIGVAAGVICFSAVRMKPRFGYDDALDVVGRACGRRNLRRARDRTVCQRAGESGGRERPLLWQSRASWAAIAVGASIAFCLCRQFDPAQADRSRWSGCASTRRREQWAST